ncbi:MAG: DMT family protein [Phycisphaeraceae bacterium]|nr:DMT family protein [Phycisphaeraceae bacterium]MCW5753972.1 DMT family protein [Phycisphaeraceae bacterium]
MNRIALTVMLLIASNVFMTFAWYFHLKMKGWTIAVAILISWLIALPEYILQVPANRVGHFAHGGPLTAAQLKIIQEAITLTIFGLFSIYVLREKLRVNEIIAFGLIMAGVVVGMMGRGQTTPVAP